MRRESVFPAALLGMSLASVLNAMLFEVGRRMGATFTVAAGRASDSMSLDMLDVMIATVVVMTGGTILFGLLKRFLQRRTRTIWAGVALLVFALSFVLVVEPFEPAAKFWLSLMHCTPLVSLFVVLRLTGERD